jgi:hypothetical protein
MIAKGTLLSAVRSSIRLGKSAVVMIPLGCHDGKHLAAFKGHLNDMFVWKTDCRFGRKFVCNENVHLKEESGSRAT